MRRRFVELAHLNKWVNMDHVNTVRTERLAQSQKEVRVISFVNGHMQIIVEHPDDIKTLEDYLLCDG